MWLASAFAMLLIRGTGADGFDRWQWSRLPDLPCAMGVGGAFAGVSGNVLIVAGGANFPAAPPWKGGKKVWHEVVYTLQSSENDPSKAVWRTAAQRLPRPLGYGVSATYDNAMICVGGGNAEKNFADCFRVEWRDGRLVITTLPPLPQPLANGCGALVGDTLFVAGGQETPDATEASREVYSLDLSSNMLQWRHEPPLPGPGRIQAVAAACDGSFWVVGGSSLSAGSDGATQRQYLKDGYRFSRSRDWEKIAELPWSPTAAPSPAPTVDDGFFILGGSDGSQVGLPPDQHPGFVNRILWFDLNAGHWCEAGTSPAPRVTATVVHWAGRWVIPSGEIRPGVRSPEVWTLSREGTR